jgi:hypothetical protein
MSESLTRNEEEEEGGRDFIIVLIIPFIENEANFNYKISRMSSSGMLRLVDLM